MEWSSPWQRSKVDGRDGGPPLSELPDAPLLRGDGGAQSMRGGRSTTWKAHGSVGLLPAWGAWPQTIDHGGRGRRGATGASMRRSSSLILARAFARAAPSSSNTSRVNVVNGSWT